MALNAIEVFENTVYESGKDLLNENIKVFNGHSNGAIVLSTESIQGDFAQTMSMTLGKDLIKSRNPYANGALTDKNFIRQKSNIVKLGMGLNPVSWTNAEFNWVKQNPEEAGVIIGRAMAEQSMRELANYAIGSVATCLLQNNTLKREIAASADVSHNDFVQALAPMGDQYASIELFVIHSGLYFRLLETTFKNAQQLWNFGNYTVMQTALGQKFLICDNKGLEEKGKALYGLGLKKGSVRVGSHQDYQAVTVPISGNENLGWRYQAEWTSALQVANRRYKTSDSMNGLTLAAVTNASNWETISNDVKDETGVILVKKLV